MVRRLLIAGSVSFASMGGLALAAPAAHADGQVCVNANVNIAGNQLVDQAQCQSLPGAPSLPSVPPLP